LARSAPFADPVARRAPASTSSTTLFKSGVDAAALDDLIEAAYREGVARAAK
jgi:hypothetical protein